MCVCVCACNQNIDLALLVLCEQVVWLVGIWLGVGFGCSHSSGVAPLDTLSADPIYASFLQAAIVASLLLFCWQQYAQFKRRTVVVAEIDHVSAGAAMA